MMPSEYPIFRIRYWEKKWIDSPSFWASQLFLFYPVPIFFCMILILRGKKSGRNRISLENKNVETKSKSLRHATIEGRVHWIRIYFFCGKRRRATKENTFVLFIFFSNLSTTWNVTAMTWWYDVVIFTCDPYNKIFLDFVTIGSF